MEATRPAEADCQLAKPTPKVVDKRSRREPLEVGEDGGVAFGVVNGFAEGFVDL